MQDFNFIHPTSVAGFLQLGNRVFFIFLKNFSAIPIFVSGLLVQAEMSLSDKIKFFSKKFKKVSANLKFTYGVLVSGKTDTENVVAPATAFTIEP